LKKILLKSYRSLNLAGVCHTSPSSKINNASSLVVNGNRSFRFLKVACLAVVQSSTTRETAKKHRTVIFAPRRVERDGDFEAVSNYNAIRSDEERNSTMRSTMKCFLVRHAVNHAVVVVIHGRACTTGL